MLSASKSLLELGHVRASFTGLYFRDLRAKSPDLYSVETCDCFVFPTASATAALFAERFPELASEYFVGCLNRADAAVGALAEHCSGLTSVDPGGCRNMADAAVVALAEHRPGLTSVDLGCCENLTNAAVVAIAEHCPGFALVDVRSCENLTDAASIWSTVSTYLGGKLTRQLPINATPTPSQISSTMINKYNQKTRVRRRPWLSLPPSSSSVLEQSSLRVRPIDDCLRKKR